VLRDLRVDAVDIAINLPHSDHLFLLIGSNPLPNAVAGRLLGTQGGTITLIHSENSFQVAQRLQSWLIRQRFPNVRLKEVGESHPVSIAENVRAELQAINARHVGLHYTGGTKAMSVHAYRAVDQWVQGKGVKPVFSYLDARRLQMEFDPADPFSGEPGQGTYIGRAVELTLTDLLELHGWTLQHFPTAHPLLPVSARALAMACEREDAFKVWKQWIHDELRAKCRRPDKDEWKTKTALKSIVLHLSEHNSLDSVARSIHSELNQAAGSVTLEHPVFDNNTQHFCEWLDGKWLEHYVLDALNSQAAHLKLHQCVQNIETAEVQFDVDVIGLRGYQLFAFSCSTDTGKSLLKSKLFEAYIRARQLGGDEARVALVCCSADPEGLEHEMRCDVDPEGRIHVFGRKHLAYFTTHLSQWIQSQSGEE